MKKLFTFVLLALLSMASVAQEVDITSNFSYTWNGDETFSTNEEHVVVYNAVQWGGLACWLGGADWSAYEKLVVEFAEATSVGTQILVQGSTAQAFVDAGATELICNFSGIDMTAVEQVALQANASGTIYVKRVYLVEGSGTPVVPSNEKDILPQFTGTWNGEESVTTNDDGSKEYTAVAWGGMSAWFGGVDWSDYDALVMEFAEATTTGTKITVLNGESAEIASVEGAAGITSLTCLFGDADMSNVSQAALQSAEATTITVTRAYLVKYASSALSFDAAQTHVTLYVTTASEGMDGTYRADLQLTESGWGSEGENVLQGSVKKLILSGINTAVTGGEASEVEAMGWCYHADKEKKEDEFKEFVLTQGDDGQWSVVIGMDIVETLGEEDDWILEIKFIGKDADGNEFVLDNGGENYKIYFSNKTDSKKGDVNEDGEVNINDVVAIINVMAGTAEWKNANVNGDEEGKIDINDVVAVINIMAGV